VRTFKTLIKWLSLVTSLAAALMLVLWAYWYHRPNTAVVAPELELESWPAVAEGMHDSNTDLLHWRGRFYLVHARSPYHLGSGNAKLVVWRSDDARTWEKSAEIVTPDEDLRDPKLVAIGDKLHLYALINHNIEPEPHATALSTSEDGVSWSPLQTLQPEGWLFWRPKSRDGVTWYVTAYWHEHGASRLLSSRDGVNWDTVSTIHEGDRNDETALAFLPDGRILVTARLEGERAWHQGAADAATLLAVAAPPYTSWSTSVSKTTRLDGPVLFEHEGRVFAVGRFDPEGYDSWYRHSSLFGRKRTALYEVRPDKLVYLSDLPSAGDTAYAGVAVVGDDLYISYYTSDIERDYSWYLGLVTESNILMAKLPLRGLEALADAKAASQPVAAH